MKTIRDLFHAHVHLFLCILKRKWKCRTDMYFDRIQRGKKHIVPWFYSWDTKIDKEDIVISIKKFIIGWRRKDVREYMYIYIVNRLCIYNCAVLERNITLSPPLNHIFFFWVKLVSGVDHFWGYDAPAYEYLRLQCLENLSILLSL